MATRELQPGDVLSVREAAKEIGVHFTTLYRWVEAGEAIFISFGGNIFIPMLEIERLKRLKKGSNKEIPNKN